MEGGMAKPWVAIVLAGLTSLMGAWIMLASLRWIPGPGSTRGHEWMGLVVGGVFCFGGAAAVLGQFPSALTTAINNGLSLLVVLGLTSLFGFVALGPGHHQIASPFMMFGPKVGEAAGRIAFGLGTALGGLIFVMMARSILRRTVSTQAPTSAT
jgi:hypothetical protein